MSAGWRISRSDEDAGLFAAGEPRRPGFPADRAEEETFRPGDNVD